ncbi:MAG: DCC1-like thiol-disulfide oxidoreductase family protein [Planctomycetota bacterium]
MSAPTKLPSDESARPLLLFDGECGLCTGSVRFILDRERDGRLHFASLQSALGRSVAEANGLDPDELSTLVLVDEEGGVSLRSTAALKVAAGHLRLPWRLAGVFRIVPRFLRDGVYRFIAARRIQWFGTADACELPAPGVPERFVG